MINSLALSQNPQDLLKPWHTLTSVEYYGVYSNPPKLCYPFHFHRVDPGPA